MILGSGLLQSGVPSFGTLAADSSDSTLFSGFAPNVAVAGPVSQRLYFGKSGGTWTTLWTDTSGALLRGDEAGTHAVTLASNGPEPFDTDDGLATDVLSGSVAAGTTFTHEADCLIEATITLDVPASNKVVGIVFRYIDVSHYWRAAISPYGSIRLYERNGAGEVELAAAIGVFSSGQRMVVVCENESIGVYSNDVLRISYGSAASSKTATSGATDADFGTDGAVSNLKSWPRTLSGIAASVLNKASA